MQLATEFDVPLATFIQGIQGGAIIGIGFGSLICNSLAVKFGKRPIYLATTLMLMVSCFWCAAAKSFASLVAARVVQGFSMGPLEALIPASIADVWLVLRRFQDFQFFQANENILRFVHERGYRSSIFNLGVLGGINLAQPIGEFSSSSTYLQSS